MTDNLLRFPKRNLKKGKERIKNKTKAIQYSYLNIGSDFVCFTFIGMVGHTVIVVIISYNKTTRK